MQYSLIQSVNLYLERNVDICFYWHVFRECAFISNHPRLMKLIFTILTSFILLSSFTYLKGIDEIVAALKNGNAAQVARYFDNSIEITLPQKSNTYSKSQGEMILRDFFVNNSIKGFDVIHQGENAGSYYCIGTLITRTAQYRTTFFIKQKGDRQIIQEIRFENR